MGASMNMGSSSPNACKISMLWNWYTLDACFIASTWHITSAGMFAGSCIGVVCLVLVLEFLRRVQREYDRHITQSLLARRCHPESSSTNDSGHETPPAGDEDGIDKSDAVQAAITPQLRTWLGLNTGKGKMRVRLGQRLVRAGIHTLQFAAAYVVMLLAMYYNGYIIICILIGAFLGAVLFGGDMGGSEV
ncbi:Copper Transporter integral membrane protein that functions in high affinity copper transport [Xylographa soralifera]|nr:Copper Transporter integral membrane protein that functions in high affinity copper transport [Xylographa soralifera]